MSFYNSQMACKLLHFQISVIYVNAEATSIMSCFMIYNVSNIKQLQRSNEQRWEGEEMLHS